MKILLGTCLALLLASGAPAFAASTTHTGAAAGGAATHAPTATTAHPNDDQNSDDQDATEDNNDDTSAAPQQGPRHHRNADRTGPRHHGRYFNHQWAHGEQVPPRFLRGRRVITDYARFNVEAPRGGDRWLRAPHRQLLLVSADGRVKAVIQRQRRHPRRDNNAPQGQGDSQQQ